MICLACRFELLDEFLDRLPAILRLHLSGPILLSSSGEDGLTLSFAGVEYPPGAGEPGVGESVRDKGVDNPFVGFFPSMNELAIFSDRSS